jgi:hypothetical protein
MIHENMRGQSLVEVLIAVAIGSALLAVGAALIRPALQQNAQVGIVQAKTSLGNELLNNVRAWAAGNWNSVLALGTTSAHLYYLNTSSSPFTAVAATSGESVAVGSTTYIRYFYADDVYRTSGGDATTTASGNATDPSTKQITVMVNVVSSTVASTTFVAYLTRNASNIFNQSDWSGGGGAAGPMTLVNNQFASSTYINASTSGALTITQTATNGKNADYILGQADFTSKVATTTQNGMYQPAGLAYDSQNGRLFVADYYNHRVLVFNNAAASTLTANGENADYVLGQSGFTTRISTTTQSGMYYPSDVAHDSVNSRLFVADSQNNRVLVFNVASGTISNGKPADFVLGQTNFTTWTAGRSGSTFSTNGCDSMALAYDSQNARLFVADGCSSGRVLVFNVAPGTIANGEGASYVLGQPNFTSNIGTTTQSGMSWYDNSLGIAYDSLNSRLFAADEYNNRVLVFNVASGTIANGENADYVLGQPNFTTSSAWGTTQNEFDCVVSVGYDPVNSRLFVGDGDNYRVLVFNVALGTIANNENASYVLGQPDFTTKDSNGPTQDSLDGLSDWSLSGLSYDSTSHRLFVADSYRNRVLIFNVANLTF